jgi:hypothetical protein
MQAPLVPKSSTAPFLALLVASALHGQEPLPSVPGDMSQAPPVELEHDTIRAGEREPSTAAGVPTVVALVRPDGPHGEAMRVAEMLGRDAPRGLLRAPSTLTARYGGGRGVHAAVLMPEAVVLWNSAIPASQNEGALWGGRGLNARTTVGLLLEMGPLRMIAAPELVWSGNRAFTGVIPAEWRDAEPQVYQPPWQTGPHSIDMPYRFGDVSRTEWSPGQSSLALHAGPVVLGAATENHWWGPGSRNAIVLSTHAPGFPHLFLRTDAPVRTPLGALEARWLVGRLEGSGYAPAAGTVGGERSLAAIGATLAPSGTHGLTLGAARSVYAPVGGAGRVPGRFVDVLRRWDAGRPESETAAGQILSVFARLVVPQEGAELYAEWARHEVPASLRDLLLAPEHTQGFTVGAGWAREVGAGAVRLNVEVSHLERSPTFRARPIGSFYASERVPAGYTHRGRVVGAAVGPGAQAQWLSAEYTAAGGGVGVFGGRTRAANDAYFDQPGGHRRYLGHDVTVYGGASGALTMAGYRVAAEWTAARRYNYLFQNWATSFADRENAVNVVNHSLRVSVTPRLPAWP